MTDDDNRKHLLAQWASDLQQAHRRLAHGLMADALASGSTLVDPRATLGAEAAETVKLVQWFAETWAPGAPDAEQLTLLRNMHQTLQAFFASHERKPGAAH
jgi:hypothetical protein